MQGTHAIGNNSFMKQCVYDCLFSSYDQCSVGLAQLVCSFFSFILFYQYLFLNVGESNIISRT